MQLYWIHMLLLILFLMVFAACDFLTILSFPSLTSSPSQSSYHLPLPLPWTRYILTCPFSLLPCPALPTYYLFEFGKRKEKEKKKKKGTLRPCKGGAGGGGGEKGKKHRPWLGKKKKKIRKIPLSVQYRPSQRKVSPRSLHRTFFLVKIQ